MNERAKVGRFLLVGWLGLLIFVIYGRILTFPFFSDDFFQLPFLDSHTFPQLWQTAEGLFFFRPLAFSLWKLWHTLLGHYQPAAFHLLNILFHWLNAVLVAQLFARLSSGYGRWLRAGLAATLFALFPFAYEAVAWVAAVMHPFFLTLTLLSITSYLQMRRSKRPFLWLTVGLLTAALSPFAHENGVLTAPLIWTITLTMPGDGKLKRNELLTATLWLLPTLLWFIIWQQVPARDGSGGLSFNPLNIMLKNALYLIQGLGYPLSWFGGWLRDNTSLAPNAAALAATLPAILLLIAVDLRRGLNRKRLLPWLWTAVSIAPPILFLPNLHVIAAPRMLMLPAVGIVWLWSEAFWYFYSGKQTLPPPCIRFRRHYRLGIAALLFAFLLIQNTAFIRKQLGLYHIGGTAIEQAGLRAVEANMQGRTAVFINLPAWIAPLHSTYALGQEGDNLILGPDMVEPLVWSQTGQHTDVSAVRYDDIRIETPYYTGPVGDGLDLDALLPQNPVIYVSRYQTAAIQIEPAAILNLSSSEQSPLATFGETIRLLNAETEPQNDRIILTLTWQIVQPAPFEMTVFVHGLDQGGTLIEQADGDPAAGTIPFGTLPVGTVFQDIRTLSNEHDLLQIIRIGLYNRFDGTRWPALDANAQPYPDNAVPFDIPH